MPLLQRCAEVGAISAGVIGGIVGLIVGLHVNPPTAWFATLELGVPASIAGGLAGGVVALSLTAGRRIKRSSTSAT